MVKDFINKKDLPLFTSGSRFSIGRVFIKEKKEHDIATFDLFIREMPKSRKYFIFAGLEHVITYLQNIKLNKQQIDWLKKCFRFNKEEVAYFKKFKFTGDMQAMPEGSIVFPNEPIIRITAPIIEAQIIEMFLINTVYLQTIMASKMSRFLNAANGKEVGLGFNRSYGTDAAMKSTRIAKIFNILSSLAAYDFLHGEKAPFSVGTFHYSIMCFNDEVSSFRAYLKHTRGAGYVLIDTYDSINGIKNFIQAAKEVEKQGIKATGIQLDSGDIYKLSVTARKMLDQAGLHYTKIFAMGNLNEYKVASLEKRKAPIDFYAGVTSILTPDDAPTLELVYKLSELKQGDKIIPKMKTTSQKVSLPGRKQVFRQYSKDIIGLDNEKIKGKKILIPIIKKGKLIYQPPSIKQIGDYYRREKKKFSPRLFTINEKMKYPVHISPALKKLASQTKRDILLMHK